MEPLPTPTIQNTAPIGIFDSGVGGLSVWREIVRLTPNESTLYVADQAHVPYGTRSLSEVQDYAKGITRFLLARGAKIIVVACNTASGAALHVLRDTFPNLQFVGMEPAVKPAAEHTRTGVIAVIATPATFQAEMFHSLVERFATGVRLEKQICPGLVEQVERGALNTAETDALLRSCMDPLLREGADHLVLGCTHYPFLRNAIRHIVGPSMVLVDPAPAVARQTARILTVNGLAAPENAVAKHNMVTTGSPETLRIQALNLVKYRGPVTAGKWEGSEILEIPNQPR